MLSKSHQKREATFSLYYKPVILGWPGEAGGPRGGGQHYPVWAEVLTHGGGVRSHTVPQHDPGLHPCQGQYIELETSKHFTEDNSDLRWTVCHRRVPELTVLVSMCSHISSLVLKVMSCSRQNYYNNFF